VLGFVKTAGERRSRGEEHPARQLRGACVAGEAEGVAETYESEQFGEVAAGKTEARGIGEGRDTAW